MSQPIGYCTIAKAANGDEEAYKFLIKAMDWNIRCGHFTQFPCNCEPKCTAPKEALEKLQKRMEEDPVLVTAQIYAKNHPMDPTGPEGPRGPECKTTNKE